MDRDFMQITAPVFNIQTYSIHDGPGIRVTVFVKGCPLNCIWCQNPESKLATPQLMTYSVKCTGCGACAAHCRGGAIALRTAGEKTLAVTEQALCDNCGVCAGICPNGAREIVGKDLTVAEVLEKAMKDKLFMDASGGGITLSGGEGLLYPDFSEALFYASKQAGLNTAIETSCFAARQVIEQVFRHVDFALLDLKHMDSAAHRRFTGVPNELILENICYINNDMKKQVVIRVPVIPGYNDSHENIAATAAFVRKELGADVRLNLLPYHRLGESKNENLGNAVNFSIEIPSDAQMNGLKKLVESYGLKAQIGG